MDQYLQILVNIIKGETIFWIIIAILFLILWRANVAAGNEFKKEMEELGGKRLVTNQGAMIVVGIPEFFKEITNGLLKTSKLSEYGFIISIITAILSAILSIYKF
nr:hypothetical protein [uncultured Methanobacterium sp.]